MNKLRSAGTAILQPVQLQRLREYREIYYGTSLFTHILDPYWNSVMLMFPNWIAPNLIKLTGFFIAFSSGLLLAWKGYDPGITNETKIPTWLLVTAGCGLFVHQTLDAVARKHALRLKQESALIVLLDHGLNSVLHFIMYLSAAVALQMGQHIQSLFIFVFSAYFVFYLCHWEAYVKGRIAVERIDIVEVQLGVMLIYIITAVFGCELWLYKVAVLPYVGEIKLWQFLYFYILLAFVHYCRCMFSRILAGGKGKNGSSVADTSVLSPGIPVIIIIMIAIYIYGHDEITVFEKEPLIACLIFCPCLAKITWKLLLSFMTRCPVDVTDSIMAAPIGLILINYLALPVKEHYALFTCMIYGWFDFLTFCTKVCFEISTYLKINIFTITEKNSQD